MTIGQIKLIENYNSLRSKIESNEIGSILQFCSYFQTDDVELFLEFKNKTMNTTLNVDSLIELYAKRYNLDSKKDIEKIMYIFLENTINNGISYHLNSSANFSSIMELGLGISAIGLKTAERQDYEKLVQLVEPDTFKRLQPFHGEKKGSKLYFSNVPILKARYGDRPEWLKELKLNSHILEDDPKTQMLVNEILQKYDLKYNGAKKMLFLIPNPAPKLTEDIIEELLKRMSPKEIMSYFYGSLLSSKDLYTNKHISSSEIIAVDLDTFDLYYTNNNGKTTMFETALNNHNSNKR